VVARGRRPSDAKRAAILHAATTRFLREGLAGTSMDAVAAEAGVSKQTVYGHFGDKDGLFRAVIESARRAGPPAPGGDGAPLIDPADLHGSLVRTGRALLHVVFDPRIAALRRLLIFEVGRRPEVREWWVDGAPSALTDSLTQQIADIAATGRLDVPDPGVAVRQLIGLWVYPTNFRTAYGLHRLSDADADDILSAGADLFLRAHAPRPTEAPSATRGGG